MSLLGTSYLKHSGHQAKFKSFCLSKGVPQELRPPDFPNVLWRFKYKLRKQYISIEQKSEYLHNKKSGLLRTKLSMKKKEKNSTSSIL